MTAASLFGSGLVVALCGLLGACDTDVDRRVALAGISGACRINSDCSELLVCAFELCHEECNSSRDCQRDARCVTTSQGRNVCQLPNEAGCSRNDRCQGSQVCAPDRQCRDGCRSDSDCVADQRCSGGACADASELDATGQLPASDTPPEVVPCAFDSDCPGELVCLSGACRTECQSNADCREGQACESGACRPAPAAPGSCLRHSDCESGLSCLDGRCTETPTAPAAECRYDSDCGVDGQHCTDGACRCECAETADCAAGKSCVDACRCEPGRVIQGDVQITNDLELRAFQDVVELTGQLLIQINRRGNFHVRNLRRAGSISVGNPSGTIHFDSLSAVSGFVSCNTDCVVDQLQHAGDITLTSSLISNVRLPKLETAGDLSFMYNSALTSIDLPELRSASEMQIISNSELASLRAPKLTTLKVLNLQYDTTLRSVSLPLAAPDTRVEARNLPWLETLELPGATTLSDQLAFADCPRLTRISLERLAFSEQMQLMRLPKLQELRLPALERIPGGALLMSLGELPVDLPALESTSLLTIGESDVTALRAAKLASAGQVQLNIVPKLAQLDLQRLKTIGTLYVDTTGLTNLTSLTKAPVGNGVLESANNVRLANNPALPDCAVTAFLGSLGSGLSEPPIAFNNLSCPCNGAVCQ